MRHNPLIVNNPGRAQSVVPVPTGSTNVTPYTFVCPSFISRQHYLEEAAGPTSGTRRRWNSVSHYKRDTDLPAQTGTCVTTTNHTSLSPRWLWTTSCLQDASTFGGTRPWSLTESFSDLVGLYSRDPVDGFLTVKEPPDLSLLIQDSLFAILPKIKPQLSLLNSLIELKDFKSLRSTVSRVRDGLGALSLRLRNRDSGLSLAERARRVLRGGSDSYLQTQFNILPLLADITGVYNTVLHVEKQIETLLRNEGRLKIGHYARPLTDPYVDVDETVVWPGASTLSEDILCHRTSTYSGRPMFRAHCLYSYKFRDYQRVNARALGVLDSLGVGGFQPSILWNALPWSFVVDWVFGVNRWLKRNLDEGAMDPMTRIHNYLWSFQAKRETMWWANFRYNTKAPAGSNSSMVLMSRVSESAFIRQHGGLGSLSSALKLSGLNPKEFSLAAALAISRTL